MSGCVENPTVRVRAPSMMAANGRHGRSPRGLVTAAPKRETRASGSADGRTVTPSLPASMNPPPFPAAEPRADSPGKDDAPPALMTSPIDDVDG
jgi:hypothetical protein